MYPEEEDRERYDMIRKTVIDGAIHSIQAIPRNFDSKVALMRELLGCRMSSGMGMRVH